MGKLSLAAAAAFVVIWSGELGYAATTQQDKMKTCNAEAGSKKLSGDARKSFMSQCLSAGGAMPAAAGKSDTCNAQADAKKLAGAARTSFIKKCSAM
ncbi:MAG: PsiF family protein [Pyrinomonadaceae bacterium]